MKFLVSLAICTLAHGLAIKRAPTPGVSVGSTFDYTLAGVPDPVDDNVHVYFLNLTTSIPSDGYNLNTDGHYPVCQFSAGWYDTYNSGEEFDDADVGNDVEGQPGKKWLDIRKDSVRLAIASKIYGCTKISARGTDAENVDAFQHDNGLGLTKQDAIDYVQWLGNKTHDLRLDFGVEGISGFAEDVVEDVDYVVAKNAIFSGESYKYSALVDANVPILDVEFPGGIVPVDTLLDDVIGQVCGSKPEGFSVTLKSADYGYVHPC